MAIFTENWNSFREDLGKVFFEFVEGDYDSSTHETYICFISKKRRVRGTGTLLVLSLVYLYKIIA